jgi:hypothetical protein
MDDAMRIADDSIHSLNGAALTNDAEEANDGAVPFEGSSIQVWA